MSGEPQRAPYVRRRRTKFSEEQLRALRKVFEQTRCPVWKATEELASGLHLDELVVKAWFKNQRAKCRKEQRKMQPNPLPDSSTQAIAGEEGVGTAANARPPSPRSSDDHEQEPQLPSHTEQPAPAAAPGANSSWDSQPPGIQQIRRGDSDPPWASLPYDVDQLVELYALPGEEDRSSLDRYLLPGCLD